jgi:hypothetical protein
MGKLIRKNAFDGSNPNTYPAQYRQVGEFPSTSIRPIIARRENRLRGVTYIILGIDRGAVDRGGILDTGKHTSKIHTR